MDLSSNIPTASSPLGSLPSPSANAWLVATLLTVLGLEGTESRVPLGLQ